LCIVFVGFFISSIGLFSIWAARTALNGVRHIFHCQFADTNTERYGIAYTFSFTSCGQQIIVPSIMGGGVRKAHGIGLISPILIPIILQISWLVAFSYSIWYLSNHIDYAKAILLGAKGCHLNGFLIRLRELFAQLHVPCFMVLFLQ